MDFWHSKLTVVCWCQEDGVYANDHLTFIEHKDTTASYADVAQSNLAKLRRTGVQRKCLTDEEVLLRIGM